MPAKPLRRRPRGSLLQVQKALYAVVDYNLSVIEDPAADPDLKQRCSTALVQAALAWAKLAELCDLEKGMQDLQDMAQGNGHHP